MNLHPAEAPEKGIEVASLPLTQATEHAMNKGSNRAMEKSWHDEDPRPKGQHQFAFRKCAYTVTVKGETKYLLQDINGTINSGEVLAIMGPSGAGKTTLLNLLTLNNVSGNPIGEVTLNGQPLTSMMFSKYCSVVTQVDAHWAFLTCREVIQYAADCYLSESASSKKAKVDELIKEMGLSSCENTRCGNQFLQGLSGGQKRRLSLAVALIKQPQLVFLDEPTSGLDAAAATGIMAFLKELAVKRDIIVCCTIHQPSSKVFAGFDSTMVLADGKVAYVGRAEKLVPYLEVINRPLPGLMNPAEFMLDLVNREFTDPAEVDKVLDLWPPRAPPNPEIVKSELPQRNKYGTSRISQTMVLLRRHAYLIAKDPSVYIGRMVMFVFCCAFFCLVYLKARDRKQEQSLYRMWLILWTTAVPVNLAVIAVFAFNIEFQAVKREIRDGMFSPVSFLLSNFLLQLPMMFMLSMCAIGLSVYSISDFDGSEFPTYWITMAVILLVGECCAQFLSVVFSNPLLGMLCYMNYWFASFLFSGLMVTDSVMWPFRIFKFISIFKFGIAALTKIEFNSGTTFEGAILQFNPSTGEDFTCTGLNELQCYGRTGSQVLDSLANTYQSLGSDTNVAEQIGILCAIAAGWKLLYIYLFWTKTTSMKQPAKP